MKRTLVLGIAVLAGCGEHWHAYDEVATPFRGPGVVGVRVTTTPEAWPESLYSNAVRFAFYGAGPIRLVDEAEHDVMQGGDDWVNVLDAWRGCDRDAVCERELWVDVGCYDDACVGELGVDAFLSTSPLPEPDRGGELRLELILPDGGPAIGL